MFSVLPSPGPTLEPVTLRTLVLLPLKFPFRRQSRTSFSPQLAVYKRACVLGGLLNNLAEWRGGTLISTPNNSFSW